MENLAVRLLGTMGQRELAPMRLRALLLTRAEWPFPGSPERTSFSHPG
jgi:hypothetical protein